jgi:hypothetical protein
MKTRTPHHRLPLAALSLGLILALPAQAALHDRGGGLIYDDVLKITWLTPTTPKPATTTLMAL